MDKFYIGAYWRVRKESLDVVVNKTIDYLKCLSQIDDAFLQWFEKGNSKSIALNNVIHFNTDQIQHIYKKGIKKGDMDVEGYSKMGFRISGWSGGDENNLLSFSISAGDDYIRTPNNCILNFPYQGQIRDKLLTTSKIIEIMKLIVVVWQPDYAVFQSSQLRDFLDAKNFVGWITYYSNKFSLPDLSNEYSISKINDLGKIISIDSTYDINNKKDIEKIKNLKSILNIRV